MSQMNCYMGTYQRSRTRRLKLAGHCTRHPEEAASNLVLWVPDRGSRGRGRPTGTFMDTLMRDTGLQLEEMHACMQDKGQWRTVVALELFSHFSMAQAHH